MDIALIIYGNRRFKSLPSFLQLFSTDSFPETWNVKVYSLAQIVRIPGSSLYSPKKWGQNKL